MSQSRILFVKNISHKARGEDLYELFGKHGPVRQIRLGNSAKTRGTAFVIYDELGDAKQAFEHVNGFHLLERYLVVLYHLPTVQAEKDLKAREEALEKLKAKHDIRDD